MKYGRIFLVFSDTGAGHRSAAEALKRSMVEIVSKRGEQPPEIVMQDIIEESNAINRLFEHMYNRLLKDRQEWMKYYFQLIEWVKPNDSELGYQLCKSYTQQLIKELAPKVIVSVHPMVNHFLARTLKDLDLSGKVKLITVLTDPSANLWTGWACPDADLTIAPNDLAREKLLSLGLAPSKVKVIGMPIKPEFLKPPQESRHDFLSGLGLKPEQATIIITAGSAGGGNMAKIYEALKQSNREVQVIFLCGRNARLQAKMEKVCQSTPLKTVVMPYISNISDGMNACDLLVTKAGGLTTFEAVARRLPMALDLLVEPMPQEAGNVELLLEAGLAKAVKEPEDILPIVEDLEVIHERTNLPLPTVHNLDRVDAVYDIAQLILAFSQSAET